MSGGARGFVSGVTARFERHATGITMSTVLVLGLGLGVAPDVPEWLRPVDLSSDDARTAVLERIFKQPKMTFEAWHEDTEEVADDAAEEDATGEDAVGEDAAGEDAEEPTGESGEAEVAAEDGADAASRNDGDEAHPGSDGEGSRPEVAEAAAGQSGPAKKRTGRLRRPLKPTPEALALRRLGKRLDARGGHVKNPCLERRGEACVKTALDPFFAALDALDRGEPGTHATVLTLGNSLIASDHVTDIVRDRLVERFGDGGRGFLLPDRLSKIAGRRVRTGYGTKGWEINTFAQKPPKRASFGFTGSHHESTRKGDRTSWTLKGAESAQLYWLDHEGSSSFVLDVDGQQLAAVAPAVKKGEAPKDRVLDLRLPKGAKKLTLTADGAEVVIYGVALTRDEPGVSWDTIGVPASDSEMYMTAVDEGIFVRQLKARQPDLVVLMLGGNETRSLAFGWTDPDEVRAHYGGLVDRVQAALPGVACLAVTPIDAAKATSAGAKLTTRTELFDVVALEREVAKEKGCAFFDLFAAMGGEGSLHKFRRAGFVHDDLVHPKGKGGDILGQLLADALLESWVKTPPPEEEIKTRRRLVPPRLVALSLPSGGLTGVADENTDAGDLPFHQLTTALARAERRRGRVAIGQFGDEHTAAEAFTARLRSALSSRFGEVGRGLVPAGGGDRRLEKAGVKRRLVGRAEVHDGREVVLGGAMGLGGTSVRLSPAARFDLTFCHGCPSPTYTSRGFLELAWLYTPDMGKADVLVNNVVVGSVSPEVRERFDTDVQYLRIPVRGQAHTVSVIVPPDGEGPVNVLSVSQELARSGVVVDSVGLDGSTGMTMQRWRQELYGDQVARRDYDLVIAAWGSQEAELEGLDARTYRHHLTKSLVTLADYAPGADCLVVLPFQAAVTAATSSEKADKTERPDRGRAAPSAEMVAAVQRDVAAEAGCGVFDPAAALMQGAQKGKTKGASRESSAKGLSSKGLVKRGRLTALAYRKMAEALVTDLVAWHEYAAQRRAQDEDSTQKERRGAAPADSEAPKG